MCLRWRRVRGNDRPGAGVGHDLASAGSAGPCLSLVLVELLDERQEAFDFGGPTDVEGAGSRDTWLVSVKAARCEDLLDAFEVVFAAVTRMRPVRASEIIWASAGPAAGFISELVRVELLDQGEHRWASAGRPRSKTWNRTAPAVASSVSTIWRMAAVCSWVP